VSQESRDGIPIVSLRPLLAVLPQTERPAPHTDHVGSLFDREVELAPSPAELRRQRVALLTAEFRFTRPQ
jgi:hypothetical protein